MTENDNWYFSLKSKTLIDGQKIGFYSRVIQRRWILAIERTLNGTMYGSNILKTDAWNESTGKSLMQEFRNNYNVHICDISKSIINIVQEDYPNSYVMDIRKLDFPPDYFDAVLDISTSDHCEEEELDGIISNYNKTLKENGKLLLIHNSNKSIIWRAIRIFGKSSPAYSGFPPVYYFSPRKVKNLLQNDFEIEEMRCTNTCSWAKLLLNSIPITNSKIIDFFASIELNINHQFLTFFGRQYIFICKKSKTTNKPMERKHQI